MQQAYFSGSGTELIVKRGGDSHTNEMIVQTSVIQQAFNDDPYISSMQSPRNTRTTSPLAISENFKASFEQKNDLRVQCFVPLLF